MHEQPATLSHSQRTLTQPSASHSTLRRLVARYPIMAFLILAFACSWTSLIPLILSQDGFGILRLELPVTVLIAAITRGRFGYTPRSRVVSTSRSSDASSAG